MQVSTCLGVLALGALTLSSFVDLQCYVGGYFWWYYDQDCLPVTSTPLWGTLQAAFDSETTALSP